MFALSAAYPPSGGTCSKFSAEPCVRLSVPIYATHFLDSTSTFLACLIETGLNLYTSPEFNLDLVIRSRVDPTKNALFAAPTSMKDNKMLMVFVSACPSGFLEHDRRCFYDTYPLAGDYSFHQALCQGMTWAGPAHMIQPKNKREFYFARALAQS